MQRGLDLEPVHDRRDGFLLLHGSEVLHLFVDQIDGPAGGMMLGEEL